MKVLFQILFIIFCSVNLQAQSDDRDYNEELRYQNAAINSLKNDKSFITANKASYIYTGIEANYKLGRLNITPSFTPGLYAKGDGKDLGSVIEFKSDVQLSYDVDENMNLGMSYNHVSNASLGDKNPGANSYMFNLLRKF